MKTGLVLEGGALRTIYSSGACDALLDGGVMTDYVVGVSAGIAYGVSYVSKQKGRNLEILTRYAGDKRYMGMGNLLRKDNRSYFGLKFVYETIPNELVPFDYDIFAAFPGEVEAVVTNLDTGKAEYYRVPRGTMPSPCSKPPAPCPCCSPSSGSRASHAWTVARRTPSLSAGPLKRGVTGPSWCSPAPGTM